MIENLRIENFRGITSLELNGLKRVSLVVGQNNSGKTSLLEAVRLLCNPAGLGELPGLFRSTQGNSDNRYFRWLLRDGGKDMGILSAKSKTSENFVRLSHPNTPTKAIVRWAGETAFHNGSTVHIHGTKPLGMKIRVISVQNREPGNLVNLLGKAQKKKDGEETLQRLLAKVDPRVKKLRIDPGDDGNQIIVDVGLSELIPITQAGQGVYRLVMILADIIGETPDILLIDEIENGLHHSVQKQIWAGLAEIAETLNVQIIATTHSGECLEAAHRAFSERTNYDLSVIQLFRVPEGVQGRVLDRELIEAALEGDIELR